MEEGDALAKLNACAARMTLDQVLAFVTKAWEQRRDDPKSWQQIARMVYVTQLGQDVLREAEIALLEGRELDRERMRRLMEGQEGEEDR